MKKTLSAFLAVLMAWSCAAVPAAEANFWEGRREKARAVGLGVRKTGGFEKPLIQLARAGVPSAVLSGTAETAFVPPPGGFSNAPSLGRLPGCLASLPASLGRVQSFHPSSWPKSPLVILIQDAHRVESAQRSIAGLLAHIEKISGPAVIGLEGSLGALELSSFRKLKHQDVQRQIAEALLGKSLLSGAGYHGLTADREPVLQGLERRELYVRNVEAYRSSLPLAGPVDEAVRRMWSALAPVRERSYGRDLKMLDETLRSYEQGALPLTDFVRFLAARVPAGHGRFPEMKEFLGALDLELSLDFKKVEEERSALARVLEERLDSRRLERLVRMSLAYRAGEVGGGAYYGFLTDELARAGVGLAGHKAFGSYVRYVLSAEAVDPSALFQEVEEAKSAAAKSLSRTAEEKTVWDLSSDLSLARKLLRHELNSREWALYETRRARIAALPERLMAASGWGESGTFRWAPALSVFEDFYAAAVERDRAMVENLMKAVDSNQEQTTDNQQLATVLIAGGFHAPGLQRELARRGLSYAVVTPHIGEIRGGASDYLSAFAPSPAPLERLLLGEKLMTAPEDPLAPEQMTGQSGRGLVRSLYASGYPTGVKVLHGAAAGGEAAEESRRTFDGLAEFLRKARGSEDGHAAGEWRVRGSDGQSTIVQVIASRKDPGGPESGKAAHEARVKGLRNLKDNRVFHLETKDLYLTYQVPKGSPHMELIELAIQAATPGLQVGFLSVSLIIGFLVGAATGSWALVAAVLVSALGVSRARKRYRDRLGEHVRKLGRGFSFREFIFMNLAVLLVAGCGARTGLEGLEGRRSLGPVPGLTASADASVPSASAAGGVDGSGPGDVSEAAAGTGPEVLPEGGRDGGVPDPDAGAGAPSMGEDAGEGGSGGAVSAAGSGGSVIDAGGPGGTPGSDAGMDASSSGPGGTAGVAGAGGAVSCPLDGATLTPQTPPEFIFNAPKGFLIMPYSVMSSGGSYGLHTKVLYVDTDTGEAVEVYNPGQALRRVVQRGDVLVVLGNRTMDVLDVSDPRAPAVLASVELPVSEEFYEAGDMFLSSDGTAYVTRLLREGDRDRLYLLPYAGADTGNPTALEPILAAEGSVASYLPTMGDIRAGSDDYLIINAGPLGGREATVSLRNPGRGVLSLPDRNSVLRGSIRYSAFVGLVRIPNSDLYDFRANFQVEDLDEETVVGSALALTNIPGEARILAVDLYEDRSRLYAAIVLSPGLVVIVDATDPDNLFQVNERPLAISHEGEDFPSSWLEEGYALDILPGHTARFLGIPGGDTYTRAIVDINLCDPANPVQSGSRTVAEVPGEEGEGAPTEEMLLPVPPGSDRAGRNAGKPKDPSTKRFPLDDEPPSSVKSFFHLGENTRVFLAWAGLTAAALAALFLLGLNPLDMIQVWAPFAAGAAFYGGRSLIAGGSELFSRRLAGSRLASRLRENPAVQGRLAARFPKYSVRMQEFADGLALAQTPGDGTVSFARRLALDIRYNDTRGIRRLGLMALQALNVLQRELVLPLLIVQERLRITFGGRSQAVIYGFPLAPMVLTMAAFAAEALRVLLRLLAKVVEKGLDVLSPFLLKSRAGRALLLAGAVFLAGCARDGLWIDDGRDAGAERPVPGEVVYPKVPVVADLPIIGSGGQGGQGGAAGDDGASGEGGGDGGSQGGAGPAGGKGGAAGASTTAGMAGRPQGGGAGSSGAAGRAGAGQGGISGSAGAAGSSGTGGAIMCPTDGGTLSPLTPADYIFDPPGAFFPMAYAVQTSPNVYGQRYKILYTDTDTGQAVEVHDTDQEVRRVIQRGDALLILGNRTLEVLDVSDPETPAPGPSVTLPVSPDNGFTAAGDMFLASDGTAYVTRLLRENDRDSIYLFPYADTASAPRPLDRVLVVEGTRGSYLPTVGDITAGNDDYLIINTDRLGGMVAWSLKDPARGPIQVHPGASALRGNVRYSAWKGLYPDDEGQTYQFKFRMENLDREDPDIFLYYWPNNLRAFSDVTSVDLYEDRSRLYALIVGSPGVAVILDVTDPAHIQQMNERPMPLTHEGNGLNYPFVEAVDVLPGHMARVLGSQFPGRVVIDVNLCDPANPVETGSRTVVEVPGEEGEGNPMGGMLLPVPPGSDRAGRNAGKSTWDRAVLMAAMPEKFSSWGLLFLAAPLSFFAYGLYRTAKGRHAFAGLLMALSLGFASPEAAGAQAPQAVRPPAASALVAPQARGMVIDGRNLTRTEASLLLQAREIVLKHLDEPDRRALLGLGSRLLVEKRDPMEIFARDPEIYRRLKAAGGFVAGVNNVNYGEDGSMRAAIISIHPLAFSSLGGLVHVLVMEASGVVDRIYKGEPAPGTTQIEEERSEHRRGLEVLSRIIDDPAIGSETRDHLIRLRDNTLEALEKMEKPLQTPRFVLPGPQGKAGVAPASPEPKKEASPRPVPAEEVSDSLPGWVWALLLLPLGILAWKVLRRRGGKGFLLLPFLLLARPAEAAGEAASHAAKTVFSVEIPARGTIVEVTERAPAVLPEVRAVLAQLQPDPSPALEQAASAMWHFLAARRVLAREGSLAAEPAAVDAEALTEFTQTLRTAELSLLDDDRLREFEAYQAALTALLSEAADRDVYGYAAARAGILTGLLSARFPKAGTAVVPLATETLRMLRLRLSVSSWGAEQEAAFRDMARLGGALAASAARDMTAEVQVAYAAGPGGRASEFWARTAREHAALVGARVTYVVTEEPAEAVRGRLEARQRSAPSDALGLLLKEWGTKVIVIPAGELPASILREDKVLEAEDFLVARNAALARSSVRLLASDPHLMDAQGLSAGWAVLWIPLTLASDELFRLLQAAEALDMNA